MSTVLIATSEHLDAFKDRPDLGQIQAFSDAEALRALDVITKQRPAVVALERLFAATSRGTALINRIKADPALAACEIRIVAHDATPDSITAAAELAAASAAAAKALDQRGTRRAPRTRVSGTVDVLIDGNAASLIDVSAIGAQVVSSASLRPNQRVRLTLPDAARPIRLSAGVAWAFFEMPKGVARYRAGLEFVNPDAEAVEAWVAKLAR